MISYDEIKKLQALGDLMRLLYNLGVITDEMWPTVHKADDMVERLFGRVNSK